MKPITLHPSSMLAGAAIVLLALVVMGQTPLTGSSDQREPGVLEATAVHIVGPTGEVVARLGATDSGFGGLWLATPEGEERIALTVGSQGPDSEYVESRLAMLNRRGEDGLVVELSDDGHHGDGASVELGDSIFGAKGPVSWLHLSGATGEAILQTELVGPSLQMRRNEDVAGGAPAWWFRAGGHEISEYTRDSALLVLRQGGEAGGEFLFESEKDGGSRLSIKSAGQDVWSSGD